MSHLRFGIRLIDDLGDPSDLLALARLAEELGFDSLVFPHSPFRTNSWTLNAVVARETSRIELSCGGPIHTTDPSEIATYVATLDHLSRGRASLRMGAHNFETLTWIGIDGSDVVRRVREASDIVRRLLRGERVLHQGEIYRWTDDAYLRLRPYRSIVPITITAVGEPLLVVAYYGSFLDPRALALLGLTTGDFAPAHALLLAQDRVAARAAVTPAMLRTGIAGTPEECVRQLRAIFDVGFDQVNIGGPIGPDPATAMRLIAERVIPAFR